MQKKCYYFFKRIFDIVCSLVGIIVLIPLSLVIKISYLCSKDFHSIFFVQERIGKNGRIFKFYKFRTMVVNADEILEKWLKENPQIAKEYNKYKKLKKDPRITFVGKIIRKFSLDEFPQFVNILKGDMSLIGNRPYLLREKKDMGKYYKDIIKTKPGLTGIWQVSGRNNATFQKRLKLEKEYSNNCSFKLDMKILFKTIIVVFKGDGAM